MRKIKQGFTLIEATIGIAFISILLITIALLISGLLSSYRKGLTIRTINTTGRNLIEDFTVTASASPTKDLTSICALYYSSGNPANNAYEECVNSNANLFTYSQNYSSNISINNKLIGKPVATSGVFCTGKYSYVWNTGYTLGGEYSGGEKSSVKYTYQNETITTNEFRLLKLTDPNRNACASRISDDYEVKNVTQAFYDLTADDYALTEEPVELLSSEENGAALYDLSIYPAAQDPVSKHIFISATFILGTIQGGVNITANGNYCETPESGSDLGFDYCALNKFNFAIQMTGE